MCVSVCIHCSNKIPMTGWFKQETLWREEVPECRSRSNQPLSITGHEGGRERGMEEEREGGVEGATEGRRETEIEKDRERDTETFNKVGI